MQSNLLLRVPQITYTLDTDSFTWQFSVRNAGNMTASNVLVTNTLPYGVHYREVVRVGVDDAYLSAITVVTDTVDGREVVSFTVPTFPRNSSIQFAATGDVKTCYTSDSLWIRLSQPCGGVGNTCGGSQMERIGVQQGVGALLTSNTQLATISLCSAGNVRLVVKNASGQADLFDFVVQQALTDVTYVVDSAQVQLVRGDGTISPFVPFTPTSITPETPTVPFRQTLEWDGEEMDSSYPPEVRALLAERGPSDQLIIEFAVHTYCTASNPTVRGHVQATNVCETFFSSNEDSRAVEVNSPTLTLQKQVRNVTEDSAFAGRVLAGKDDVLVWKIDVGNTSAVDVNALLMTDTLPSWFTYTDIYTTPTTIAVPIVAWKLYTGTGATAGSPLPAEELITFWITGTVGQPACGAAQGNSVVARYACAAADVCPSPIYNAQAGVTTVPALSLDAANGTFDQCGSGPLVVNFNNTGARTGELIITYTLPSGYKYTGLDPATTPMPIVSPTVGATGIISFHYASLGQEQVGNSLRMNVTRDLPTETCLNSATVTATMSYADSCGNWHVDALQNSGKLSVLRSDISDLLQTPVTRTVEVGELYTWTVVLTNTGNGATNNLIVTETLDVGLEFVTATVGSSKSTLITPTYAVVDNTTVVTWDVSSLPAGEKWTAQVAARPLVDKQSYRVSAEAHTQCGDGGCQQSAAAVSHAAPLQYFDKQVSKSPVSIAEPFFYTITADFFGDVVYTNTHLVDTLPRLDGRLVFSYTSIVIDNSNPGENDWAADTTAADVLTFTTPSGDVLGRDVLTLTVHGIISNDVAAQRGITFTNAISLNFSVDGDAYVYTDTVDAAVKEPTLGIRKAVTPVANVSAGSLLTYTLVVTHAPASDATAYNVVITDVVPAILTYTSGSLQVSAPAPGAVTSEIVGNSLTITVSEVPTPSAPVYITYTATTNDQLQPSSLYTNTTFVRYTSQPGDNPYDRNGSGVEPNDYWAGSQAVFTSTAVSVDKALVNNRDFTVGDFITYTVWVTLPTGTTRNLIITDSIPAGLLYLAPTSTVGVTATPPIAPTYLITPSAGSGVTASQAILHLTGPFVNPTGAPAALVWTMKLLVVDDAARTVNYNGAVKTNQVNVTNLNSADQVQTITDSAQPARIFEPLLHIGKEYGTANACSARLLADNFNSGLTGWTIVNGSWNATGGWLRAPSTANAHLIHGPDTWTDISYSAIFSTTDGTGDVGLIFRAQDANNHYRFVWSRASDGSGAYQIVKVSGGAPTVVASQALAAGSSFTVNRWHHLEIRAIGRQFTVYIDGQSAIAYTDSSAPFLSGSVGFFANNQNGLAFDDALVTKIGDAGCLVESGELVTYTLTISNQERLTGHNLVITDVLPGSSLEYVGYEMVSSNGSAAVTEAPTPGSTGTLVWRVDQLAAALPFDPLAHSALVLTVTGRVIGDVSAGVRLPNQAFLSYDSQAESGPENVERTYSGGSHSTGVRTPDAALVKATAPATVTIGQLLRYTLTLPAVGGIPATLYTATVTDVLPSGFRLVGAPEVTWTPDNLDPSEITTTRSTPKTVLVDFSRVPSATEVSVVITAVVENIAANQDGVQYTNTATLGWRDVADRGVTPISSNVVTTTLVEPTLIIEKVAAPKGVRPGDIVFYQIRVYHAATSTVPAYNVVISDIIPTELQYISGSWPRDNEPVEVANTGVFTEAGHTLEAFFPVISNTLTAANPLVLTFQGVVNINTNLGSLITNVVTTTWQSLPTDPVGERRDGSGGIDDYFDDSSAAVSLDAFSLIKTGPLTATAGISITYVVTLFNSSAVTGQNATLRDSMPFQVTPITATFTAPLRSGSCEAPIMVGSRPLFTCALGDLPPASMAVVTLTGVIDPATPDGALIDNYANATVLDSNGKLQVLEDEAETWIDTVADLTIDKTGPITAMAGDLITYTVVVTNNGPSHAHGVDVKDVLPPGFSFVSGTPSQGACVSSICQLGELDPGTPVTMVITATVGPNVTGTVTNTAYIFSSTADKNSSNNSESHTSIVGANTSLRVAKTDLTDPVAAGSTYLYQVLVTNTGPATAMGVVVTDTLPPGAIFEGASPGCTHLNDMVSCVAGDMLPGTRFSFLINVRVPEGVASGTTVTNNVVISTSTQILTGTSVLTDSEPTTWVQAVGNPTDLAISKAVAGSPSVAGSGAPITFTLTVTNNGNAPATAVQVSDFFPPQLQLLSIAAGRPLTQAQCSNGGVCDLGDLAVGQSAVVTLVMVAPAGTSAGTYTNTAFVGSPAIDSNPANNTAGVPVTVTTQVGLQASKQANPNPAVVGEKLSYVIFITNTGPSNANNVTVSDALPAGFEPSLLVSSQGRCAALPCTIGALAAGSNAWVHIYGTVASTVTAAAEIANTARITASEDLAGVTASVTPGLSTNTHLQLEKTQVAPAGAVAAGGLVTYTIDITNVGPGMAHSVDIKDQLPAGLSLATVQAEEGYCAGAICQFGNLPVGASRTMTVVARVDSSMAAGTVTNTAAVFSPDAAVVTDTVGTDVAAQASLTVTKVALNNPVMAGGQQSYLIVVANDGPSDAQNVLITDTLPADTTYSGGDPSCSLKSGQVVCAIGVLPAAESRSLFINVTVAAHLPAEAQLTNIVTATSPTAATPVTDSVTSSVQQLPGGLVDLSLVKSGPVTTTAGEQLRYTLTITNSGPAAALAVNVLDALPAGVDFVAASSSQGLCERGISCQLGDLAAGATATVAVTGLVQSGVLTGVQLVNTAQVGSSNTDRNPADNRDAYTTTAEARVRLDILKLANQPNVLVGEPVQYTILVTNSGPSTGRDVVVSDILPAGLSNGMVSSSQGACNRLPCNLGELAPGATATINVVGIAAVSGLLYNSASVATSTALDPDSVLTSAALVTAAPYADLALVKDATPTALAGGSVVYTLTVTNNGPSAAAYITVTDILPAQTTFVEAQTGCTQSSGVVTCLAPTLAAGASTAFIITVTASSAITGGSSIENRASVTAATPDPTISNNADTADTSIIGQAQLALDKRASAATVTAGDLVTYTIAVTNNGPSTATSVDVKDQLPAGLTPVEVTAQEGVCAGPICQFGSLPVGASRTMTVVARVDAGMAAGTLTNTAGGFSPNAPVVTDTVSTAIVTGAALRISKVALNSPVYAGDVLFYQVAVGNAGPSDAQNVLVTDTLPTGLTYSGGDDACTVDDTRVLCSLGVLPAGVTRTLLILGRVDGSLANGLSLTNVVTASSPTASTPVTDSVTSTVEQPQGGSADLSIGKIGSLLVTAGESITYSLIITNNGPSVAENVQVVDALPFSITLTGITPSQGTCAGGIVCQLGDLGLGLTATVLVTGLVSPAVMTGTHLVNLAQVGSNNKDETPANNRAEFTTTVDNLVLLNVTKQATVDAVAPGGSLTYRIVVENEGPSLARSVVMTDLLPPELINPLLSSSRGRCDDTACDLGDLLPGDIVNILVMGGVSPFAANNLTNTAKITTTSPIHADSVLSATVVTAISDSADLVMAKSATPSVYAGADITYVLSVYNAGPSLATEVQVIDQLPPSTTLVKLDPACVAANVEQTSFRCPAEPATLDAGDRLTYTVVVRADASLATGSVLRNNAAVSSETPDPNLVNNNATADTTIAGRADLHVSKLADPNSVLAGEQLTYTVIVTNSGPSDAGSVRLVDVLPAEVTQVGPVLAERSLSLHPIICLNLVCEIGTMPLGEVITLTLPVRVHAGVADNTSFTNTATVYSPSDFDPSDNVAKAAATAHRLSTLVISKVADPDPAVTGAGLNYTIQVRNLGPSDAAGVVVTDSLPAGFILATVRSSQGDCTQLPCELGSLAAGATAAVYLAGMVQPTQGGALVNTTAVTATTPLTEVERSQTTITTPVTSQADLQIILESTATASAGLTATVYANIVNHGPSSAVGTVVTITLPSGATYDDIELPAGWTVTPLPDGQVVITTNETLPPGAQVPLTLTVNLDSDLTAGSSIEFVGDVSSQTFDPAPSNNTDTADTSIVHQAQLTIDKSSDSEVLVAGTLVTYTIEVGNDGPSSATDVDVKDQLPAGLTLVEVQAEDGYCAGALCQFGSLPVGETRTMTVVALVDPSLTAESVTNTASAHSPDSPTVTDSVSSGVYAEAELSVTKTALNDPVMAGGQQSYAIEVYNDGPSDAQAVVIEDTLPAGTTYSGGDADCTAIGSEVLCLVGTLYAGDSRSLLINVTVDAQLPDGILLTNVVTATSPTAMEPVTDSVDTLVQQPQGGLVDLAIVKSGPVTATAGEQIHYTLTITNSGPATALAVNVVDALPAGVDFVAASSSQGLCERGISCQLGDMAVDVTATVLVTALMQSGVLTGVQLVNTAQVGSSNTDRNLDDNSDAYTTTAEARVRLDILKLANAATLLVGEAVQYRIVITNSGPSTARDVVVSDLLPANLANPSVSSSQGGCTSFPCHLGDLLPGSSATINVVGTAAADGVLSNSASVTTSTALDPAGVLTSSVLVTVVPYADLALVKDATPTAIAGGAVVYTLTVTNNGPSAAQFITVTDALPAQTSFVSASPACTQSGGVVNCLVPLLAAGAQSSFSITVLASSAITAGSSIENRAAVTAATLDPTHSNNNAVADTSIIGQAQLTISKSTMSEVVTAGELITYTIEVGNSGPSSAGNVDVKDQLPAGLTLVEVQAERGYCAGALCQFGNLPVGETRTMTVVALVDPSLTAESITNGASAHSPDSPTVTDSVSSGVASRVLLLVDKQAAVTSVVPGSALTYRIAVYNAGPSTARNVVMTDLLPPDLLNPLLTSSAGFCTAAVCSLGDLLPGATVFIQVEGSVALTAADSLTNTAELATTSPLDPNSVLSDTVVIAIGARADVMLAKSATPAVYAGERITYVLSVYNAGPAAAEGVQVRDQLPPSTTLASLDAACVVAEGTQNAILCPQPAATLPAGAPLNFTVVVTADANLPAGAVLQNSALVRSSTPDPDPLNNGATAVTVIAAQPDFAIVKSGPGSVLAGALVTYVMTVTNNGPSAGYVQDIKDTLPPGLSLVSANLERAAGLTACAGTICQTSKPVAVGEVLTMTVVARADPSLPPGTLLTNTATVFADATTPDGREENNQSTSTAAVTALAQIGIDKVDLIDPVYPDSLLVYLLVITNSGPSAATDLVVTDLLPSGVTYLNSTGSCSEQPAGMVTCRVGTLLPGGRATLQVLVRVHANTANGTVLHNSALLASTTPLTNSVLTADEDTTVVTPVGPQADLAVVKSATPSTVRTGDLVTFTLVVVNNGPASVSSAQLLDLLPDGLSLVSVQPSQGFCNSGVNCLLGALPYMAGQPEVRGTATIILVARAYNDLQLDRVLTNTVYVQSELNDPTPGNNYAAAAVVVLPPPPRADVQILKSAVQDIATAGGLITYTLTVFNAGPNAAENVVVNDPLPAGVTFVSAQPEPSGGLPGAPQWQLGTMQPGATLALRLVVRTDSAALAGLLIRNTAAVTTTTEDPAPANNTASAESQVFGVTDLEVTKTANPTNTLPGELITYTIVITNHGPSAAQDVDIKEQLPPGTSLVGLTPGRGVCVSQICQFGVMTAGEQIVVTATVRLDPLLPPGMVLTNTVTSFTDTPDSNPSNNEDKEPIIVGPLVNLRISKHTQVQTATVGTEITYTLIVTNLGPADSPNVVVTDIVPAGFAYLRNTNSGGCTANGRWYVVCPIGPLPAQQSRHFDIVFFIESVPPLSVTNRAVVNDPDAFDPGGGGQGEIIIPTDPTGPSAVTIARFDVATQGNALLVTWETLVELESWSFRLLRNTVNDRSTAQVITSEGILARGSGSIYSYLDTAVEAGAVYFYWLQEIAVNGAQKEIDVTQGSIDAGRAYQLFLPNVQAPPR